MKIRIRRINGISRRDGHKVSFLKALRKKGIGHAPCAKPFLDPAR